MGVENGDDGGLEHLNKKLSSDKHFAAGEILRDLGLSFDFGFMLLEPYSTIETVRNNIAFLERFVGDGASPAGFCRTLPYAGAPLKTRLEREGRLIGTPFAPDYNFLDPRLDLFYDWMLLTFRKRNFDSSGLNELLRSVLFEAHLRLAGRPQFWPADRARLHALTAEANGHALYSLSAALDYIEETPLKLINIRDGFLARLTAHEIEQEEDLTKRLADAYHDARNRPGTPDPGLAPMGSLGGFERSWTFAEQDLPSMA
jgi:hypothetical protein